MDKWRCMRSVALMATSAILGWGVSTPALAEGVDDGAGAEATAAESSVEETFEIGGSCAALAYVSAEQMRAYVGSGYADDFHAFCYPEEPFECSDYTSFVKGVGKLATGDDGYHCSLTLAN